MSSSFTDTESPLIDSIRPRLHRMLQPLFDQTNRCLPIFHSTRQQIMNLLGPSSTVVSLAQIINRDHALTRSRAKYCRLPAASPTARNKRSSRFLVPSIG